MKTQTVHTALFLMAMTAFCACFSEDGKVLICDLGEEAFRAEYLEDSSGFEFGTVVGQTHYQEADLRFHSQAEGWYSWRDQEKNVDCALLFGGKGDFFLNIFDPHPVQLEFSCGAVEKPGEKSATLRLSLNGHFVGQAPAPRGREFHAIRFDLPQQWILSGKNRLTVELETGVQTPLPGLNFPVALSGFFRSVNLVNNPGPEFNWTWAARAQGGDLILPAGAMMRFYLAPEKGWALTGAISSRGGPLQGKIVLKPHGKEAVTLYSGQVTRDKTDLAMDLGPFDQTPCSLTLISGDPGLEKKNSYIKWSNLRITGPEKPQKETPKNSPEEKPNIVVILLDAASSFFFKTYEGEYDATPCSDELAKDSVVFRQALAPAPYTLPSVGAIMTGWLPDRHGVVWNANRDGKNMKLSANTPTIAEALKKNGYDTYGVLTNPNTSKVYGYDKGFDHYLELFKDPVLWEEGVDPHAAAARAQALLEKRGKLKPFFLYLHLFQPHAPYTPPEAFVSKFSTPYSGAVDGSRALIDGFKNRGTPPLEDKDFKRLKELYAANLAWADHAAGAFIEKLKTSGWYEDSMIILCSDHGEAFGEHRSLEHGHHLYEEGIRIPMIIKYPKNRYGGMVKDFMVSLTDLAPTIAHEAGASGGLLGIDGKNLSSLMQQQGESKDRFFLARSDIFKPSFSLRWMGWQYIYDSLNRREELYFIPNDKRQNQTLLNQSPEVGGYLRTQLCRILCNLMSKNAGEALDLEEGFIQSIESLGYAGSKKGSPVKSSSNCPLMRPKK